MSTNGLNSFALHVEDEGATEAFRTLAQERSTAPGFGLAADVRLQDLDPETAARQHLRQVLDSPGIPAVSAVEVDGAFPEFRILSAEAQPLTGTRVVKFRQTYHKVPIYGSLITVELDEQNELLSIHTSMGKPSGVEPVARIAPAEAADRARDLSGQSGGDSSFRATPRLCYYYDPEAERWRLVYVVEDYPQREAESAAGGHRPLLMDYIVDAHYGEMVAQLPRTPSAGSPVQQQAMDELGRPQKVWCVLTGDGQFQLQDPNLNVHTYDFGLQDVFSARLPGSYVGLPPEPWASAAVSAHANAATVAAYVRQVLRRNGVDNRGSPLVSSINCVVSSQSPDGREWRNAAWVAGQMVYGQRMVNGQLRSYAAGLDVVAHEVFHGVTDSTARIQYAGESGALNESYSDIFGIFISNHDRPDISTWNWQMGEDVDGTGIPLRDLSNPARYQHPDHMSKFRRLALTAEEDWGGVHINSGIHNQAAYRIITSRDPMGSYLFSPQALAALFYLALVQYLSRTSLFSDSRRALVSVARTLFRKESKPSLQQKIQAISAAFDAVGIGGGAPGAVPTLPVSDPADPPARPPASPVLRGEGMEEIVARLERIEELVLTERLERLEGQEGSEGPRVGSSPAAAVVSVTTTTASPAVRLEQFIDGLGLTYFSGSEFTPYWSRVRNGVSNSVPPQSIWANVVTTLAVLDHLRAELGSTITLISTYRSKAYNQAVGGAKDSQHFYFRAIDFTCKVGTPSAWAKLLRGYRGRKFRNPQTGDEFVFRGGIGVYPSSNFVHVDTRGFDADW
jgi:Zn-dependent metalloprotease